MGIDVRQKGASGEREICDTMNFIIHTVMKDMEYPADQCLKALSSVQRNQNQTAVGGNDLTNTFGLSIEVKRQEALSINTWWKQCEAAAQRNNEVPVLLYRQNRGKWHCVTYAWIPLPDGCSVQARVEFDFDAFKQWFTHWVRAKLTAGHEVRT